MEDGAVLGDVDVLAGEHRITELLDAARGSASAASMRSVSALTRCFE